MSTLTKGRAIKFKVDDAFVERYNELKAKRDRSILRNGKGLHGRQDCQICGETFERVAAWDTCCSIGHYRKIVYYVSR